MFFILLFLSFVSVEMEDGCDPINDYYGTCRGSMIRLELK
jgi:hypothetical protein